MTLTKLETTINKLDKAIAYYTLHIAWLHTTHQPSQLKERKLHELKIKKHKLTKIYTRQLFTITFTKENN